MIVEPLTQILIPEAWFKPLTDKGRTKANEGNKGFPKEMDLVFRTQRLLIIQCALLCLGAVFQDRDEQINRQAEPTLRVIDPAAPETNQHKIDQQIPDAVSNLVQLVRSGDLEDRMRALGMIGVFGAQAKPAVPDLIKLISGPLPQIPGHSAIDGFELHVRAVEAVGDIGPDASAAVPALLERLKCRQDSGRHAYCRTLGEIGPGAKEAIPVLEGLLEDRDLLVRLAAAVALTRIEPQPSSNAVSVLQSLQKDPELARVWAVDKNGRSSPTSRFDWQNPRIRWFTLVASVPLWRLGLEKASPVGPILDELNRSVSPDPTYINLLGDIGPEAQLALPVLEKLLKPGHSITVRREAAIAIKKIDPQEAARLGLPRLLTLQ